MAKIKKKYYAVAQGRKPGIYDKWYGEDGAEVQVSGFPKAIYKGHRSIKDAEKWLKGFGGTQPPARSEIIRSKPTATPRDRNPMISPGGGRVVVYTDGGCIRNPGPGGYGVVQLRGNHRQEFSGGFRLTTNNRMELMACIVGIRTLKRKSSVSVYSDSRYVVNGITKGWAKRWRSNGWMRNRTDLALNADLWAQLLDLCDSHSVGFVWVKGHAGNLENERCDKLATQAASQQGLAPDKAYENGKTHVSS
ncbi:MAG: ribonuclease HI [Desulfobacterales bacterium C00003060]|nr:MAG: ribonuclease HI [Desulfobacterales bacterium S3730MH5]OEU79523.1 MAG: ribonuclease HI [Desulfobacterales bacterium C00003060]OEU83676.1 MAG: ribonuclease HI [Desulfobacterales bacterium S5133MH4]